MAVWSFPTLQLMHGHPCVEQTKKSHSKRKLNVFLFYIHYFGDHKRNPVLSSAAATSIHSCLWLHRICVILFFPNHCLFIFPIVGGGSQHRTSIILFFCFLLTQIHNYRKCQLFANCCCLTFSEHYYYAQILSLYSHEKALSTN